MISWFPPLTHGIECNCISQADRVRRMSKRTTQWLNLSEITTSHYIAPVFAILCVCIYRFFLYFHTAAKLSKTGRDAERLGALIQLQSVKQGKHEWWREARRVRPTDRQRGRWRGGKKHAMPIFWLSNWTMQSNMMREFWKPIKN